LEELDYHEPCKVKGLQPRTATSTALASAALPNGAALVNGGVFWCDDAAAVAALRDTFTRPASPPPPAPKPALVVPKPKAPSYQQPIRSSWESHQPNPQTFAPVFKPAQIPLTREQQRTKYKDSLLTISGMGFPDEELNLDILSELHGDVAATVERLLQLVI
jgi:hypothetical protein